MRDIMGKDITAKDIADRLLNRYERQLALPGWSLKKQQLLGRTHLTVRREHTLAAIYAAAAGIGGVYIDGSSIVDPQLVPHLMNINPMLRVEPYDSTADYFQLTARVLPEGDSSSAPPNSLIIRYALLPGTVKISHSLSPNPVRTVELPLSNFADPRHVISLASLAILIEEVIRPKAH